MKEEVDQEQKLTSQVIEDAKNNMLPQTARTIAVNIVRGGVMIVLLIAIRIALKFITVIADAIAKLPIINQINKTTGMVYGVIRGIIIVYAMLLLLAIPGQINPNNTVNSSIENSLLGKAMYENNILKIFF